MACFTVSPLERTLAVRLGVPIFGCDPALLHLGSKSGGRKLFREAGVPAPEGLEDLAGEGDVAEALAELRARDPGLRRAVVKLDEGLSGRATPSSGSRAPRAGPSSPPGSAPGCRAGSPSRRAA
jgi:hypothetical protein